MQFAMDVEIDGRDGAPKDLYDGAFAAKPRRGEPKTLKTEWEERPASFRREAQAAMRSLIALEDWERMVQASSKKPWMAIIPVQEDNAGLTREASDAA